MINAAIEANQSGTVTLKIKKSDGQYIRSCNMDSSGRATNIGS